MHELGLDLSKYWWWNTVASYVLSWSPKSVWLQILDHQQLEPEVGVEQANLEWNYKCKVWTAMRHEILGVDACVEAAQGGMQLLEFIRKII